MKGRLFSIYCSKCNEAPHALEEPDCMIVLEDGLVYTDDPDLLVLEVITHSMGCGCDEGMPHMWEFRGMGIKPLDATLTIDLTIKPSKPSMHPCHSCRKPINVDEDRYHSIYDGDDIVCNRCWGEHKEDVEYINPAIERY